MSARRATDDRVDRLVRAANPVPNPDALIDPDLDRAGASSFDRLVDRYVATTSVADQPPDGGRRPIRAALAASVLALVVGSVLLISRFSGPADLPPADQPDDEVPTIEPSAPDDAADESGDVSSPAQTAPGAAVAIVEDYIGARNDHDLERALDLVADDFATTEPPPGHWGRPTMELAFDFDRAFGAELLAPSCAVASVADDGVRVVCDVELWTAIHDVGGFAPERRRLVATVDRGRITRVDSQIDRTVAGALGAFDAWSSFLDRHPEFASIAEGAMGLDPTALDAFTDELPHYLELYAEQVPGAP